MIIIIIFKVIIKHNNNYKTKTTGIKPSVFIPSYSNKEAQGRLSSAKR